MTEEIPTWAKERACKLVDEEVGTNVYRSTTVSDIEQDRRTIAFARYIAAHEEAPVDPLLVEAQKIVAFGIYGDEEAHAYVVGKDESRMVELTLRGIKRGMELAGKSS